MPRNAGKWDGGYIRKDKRGRKVYYIRKAIGDRHYDVSTRATSESAAHDQLKRFQANPESYDPRGDVRPDPIWLDKKLSEEFLTYSREEKKNSRGWVAEQRALLADWAEDLRGVDLRRASLRDHILPALKNVTSRSHRIEVLKVFYSWLRTVKRDLTLNEDPTAGGALKVPQADPSQRRVANKAVSRQHVELAREHLVGGWRDALDLQMETGWHVSEVARFAREGEIEPPAPSQRELGVAGVLIVPHKSGAHHRTAVSAKTLEVAQRLRERCGLSIAWYMRAVKSACKAAGLKKPFGPGQLRHSVATWAVNAGFDLPMVASFLGHRSASTTRKFYATHATPKNPMLPVPPTMPKKRSRKARPAN
ncbi:MAG: hypothetical protein E6J78_14950 [Deltaproteobacteria bacterium]|nr:MAG: hypothetical protein E6J78_14950 [Deltaproteobacteria bacterium]